MHFSNPFVIERQVYVSSILEQYSLFFEPWVTTLNAIEKLYASEVSKHQFYIDWAKEEVHRQFSYQLYCAIFNKLNAENVKRAEDKAKAEFDKYNKFFSFVPWYEKEGLTMASGGNKPKKKGK